MTDKITIDKLKSDLYSEDWTLAVASSDGLAKIGGQEILNFFISLLDKDDSSLRNLAALGIRTLADNQALEPLLHSINKLENKNFNGTMVYALQTLDCSHKLPEMFDLLFYGGLEVKMGVSAILDDQVFKFTEQNLIDIKNKWDDVKANPAKCPGFDKHKDIIQNYVDLFSRLENKTSH